ncbi:MAG: hypothetical protein ACTSW3_04085 [Promethearchaeota archaeon]
MIKDIKEHWFMLLISGVWTILVIYAFPLNFHSMNLMVFFRFIFVLILISIPGQFFHLDEVLKKQSSELKNRLWYIESLIIGILAGFMGAFPIAILIGLVKLILNINGQGSIDLDW